jgi:hypothetical protein
MNSNSCKVNTSRGTRNEISEAGPNRPAPSSQVTRKDVTSVRIQTGSTVAVIHGRGSHHSQTCIYDNTFDATLAVMCIAKVTAINAAPAYFGSKA